MTHTFRLLKTTSVAIRRKPANHDQTKKFDVIAPPSGDDFVHFRYPIIAEFKVVQARIVSAKTPFLSIAVSILAN
jgi:hypothetical protein